MKSLLSVIAIVLCANAAQAAGVACGANEKLVTECHLSAGLGDPNSLPNPEKDFSLCFDSQRKWVLNLDTQIHPSIPGTRFEVKVDTYDPMYFWVDAENKKVVRVVFPTEGSRNFPTFMRLGAMDLFTDYTKKITSDAVYQCINH